MASNDTKPYVPMLWTAHKSINHTRVQELLAMCEEKNQYTNGGPVCNYLESLIRKLLVIESKKCVVVCSSATAGLHALMASMEYYSSMSNINTNTTDTTHTTHTIDTTHTTNANIDMYANYKPGKWITQDFTSPATAQGPLQESIDIFDVDIVTGGICMDSLHKLEKSGEQHMVPGIICTNIFGNVIDIDKYRDWCHRNGDKWLILDNAATPYTFYKGRNSVNYGNGSVVSFHHSKPIGFGEGGVIVADIELEQTIRCMVNFGIDKDKKRPWLRIGSNYKMSDISAAYIIQYLEDNFENILKHHTTMYIDALKYVMSHKNNTANTKFSNLNLYPNFADLPNMTEIDNVDNGDKLYKISSFSNSVDVQLLPSCILFLNDVFTEEYIKEVNTAYNIDIRKYYSPLTNMLNAIHIYDMALCYPIHLDMNSIKIPDPDLIRPLDTNLYTINLTYINLGTTKDEIPSYIQWPDIYYTPEYGRVAQESYPGAIWECCIGTVSNPQNPHETNNTANTKNNNNTTLLMSDEPYYLIHCYLLRPTDPPLLVLDTNTEDNKYDNSIKQTQQYYDLITPIGYLGPSGSPRMMRHLSEAFNDKFAESAKEMGYLTQVIRRSPYAIPQPIASIRWHKIASKATYSVPIARFKTIYDYMDATSSSQRRAINKAKKTGLEFTIENYKYDWEDDSASQRLINMYNNTIRRISANTSYQFTDAYFSYLGKLEDKYPGSVYLSQVFMPSISQLPINNNNPIAMAIILSWPTTMTDSDKLQTNYYHYHLGGFLPEYGDKYPMNFLYYKVIEYAINQPNNTRPQLFHLGGGICTGDGLEQLHAKVALEHQSPLQYTIYGEVFNDDIYQKLENEYLESGLSKHKSICTNGNARRNNGNSSSHSNNNNDNIDSSKKDIYRKRAKKYKYFPVYKENDNGI